MSWKETDRLSERAGFVALASVEGANVAELCRRFGIARKTGYKWLAQFQESGQNALHDRSRRPNRFRSKTPDDVEQAVLEIRDQH